MHVQTERRRKKKNTHFTCQDKNILQWSEDWEIMWHQQKQTHYAPLLPPTHRHHTHTSNTHIKPFLSLRGTLQFIYWLWKHTLPVNTAHVIGSERWRKHQHSKRRLNVLLYPNLPWLVPLPGPILTSTRCSRVSYFRPLWHWGSPPPSFIPCWCSGGLSQGRQGSPQAWVASMGHSNIAHSEDMVEASEFLNWRCCCQQLPWGLGSVGWAQAEFGQCGLSLWEDREKEDDHSHLVVDGWGLYCGWVAWNG